MFDSPQNEGSTLSTVKSPLGSHSGLNSDTENGRGEVPGHQVTKMASGVIIARKSHSKDACWKSHGKA